MSGRSGSPQEKSLIFPVGWIGELLCQRHHCFRWGFVLIKKRMSCPSRGEYCSPSNPGTPQNCLRRFCGEPHSGFPPPLGTGDNPPKMRDILFVLFDKVLVSHRNNRAANSNHRTSLAGRGRRLDAHSARVYLMFRLACEVAGRAATCKSGRKRPLCKFG